MSRADRTNVNWFQFVDENSIKMLNDSERNNEIEAEAASFLFLFFFLLISRYARILRSLGRCVNSFRCEIGKKLLHYYRFTFVCVRNDSYYCLFLLKFENSEKKTENCDVPCIVDVRRMNAANSDRGPNWDESKKSKLERRMRSKWTTHMWASFTFPHRVPFSVASCLAVNRTVFCVLFLVVSFVSSNFSIPFALHFIPFDFHFPSIAVSFFIIFMPLNAMCTHVLNAIKAHTHSTRHYDWSNDIVDSFRFAHRSAPIAVNGMWTRTPAFSWFEWRRDPFHKYTLDLHAFSFAQVFDIQRNEVAQRIEMRYHYFHQCSAVEGENSCAAVTGAPRILWAFTPSADQVEWLRHNGCRSLRHTLIQMLWFTFNADQN